MKKILFLTMGLSILLFSSCTKDETSSAGRGGEVDFSISASLPRSIITYSSDQGGMSNVDETSYDLRYVCEAWTTGAIPRLAYREIQTVPNFAGGATEVTFEARLLALPYIFVFWADFVDEGSDGDKYYTTDTPLGLTDIQMVEPYEITEARDAYFAAVPVDLTHSGSAISGIMLQRPFGKFRLAATDVLDNPLLNEVPNSASITYHETSFPGGFNAMDGSVTARMIDVSGEHPIAVTPENVHGEDAYILGFDYIFASGGLPAVSLTVNSYSDLDRNELIGTRDISAIPIAQNKLTTVIGNLYTSLGRLIIDIDDEFSEQEDIPYVEVIDIADVSDALAQSASVKVVSPVEADGTIVIPLYDGTSTIAAPDQISIDLSGGIASGVMLTIDGNTNNYQGTIIITLPDDLDPGDLTINAGNAHVIVYGSYGELIANTSPTTLVIPKGSRVGKLNVTGGNVEIYGEVVSFGTIAAGSKIFWGVGTESDLRTALRRDNTYNHGVILTANIASTQLNPNSGESANQDGFYIGREKGFDPEGKFDYYAATPYDGYLFDGKGFTLSGQAFNNVMAVYAHDVVIRNLKVTQEAGMRPNGGISVYRCKNLSLENVTITGCGKEGGLIVNASTVAATGLKTSGNYYGGVILTKGTAPAGGQKPVFTFDNSCQFGEPVKVYVRNLRAMNDFTVNAPAGWTAYDAPVTPIAGGTAEAGVVYIKSSSTPVQTFTQADLALFNLIPDRHLPSAIDFLPSYEGVGNVIKYTVGYATGATARTDKSAFRNTQGAKWFVQNVAANPKWEASVRIYVTPDMLDPAYQPFRAELWTVTSDPYEYPLFGVGNVDKDNIPTGQGAKWRIWCTNATTGTDGWSMVDNAITAGWHTLTIAGDGQTVDYLVDGVKIGDAGNAAKGGHCSCLMPEVYNFNGWDPVENEANPTSYPDYAFDAYFGEMTFKLK